MQQFVMIINGNSVKASSTFDVINPATAEVFAKCQNGDTSDVDAAVAAARAAFPDWSKTSTEDRKAKIHAIAQSLEDNMPELMELEP